MIVVQKMYEAERAEHAIDERTAREQVVCAGKTVRMLHRIDLPREEKELGGRRAGGFARRAGRIIGNPACGEKDVRVDGGWYAGEIAGM